jgi:energy-coupling factor transport system ATP-binding protein
MSLTLNNVTYVYMAGTPYQCAALKNINLEIDEGEFLGIIGHTGSGKSTLVQHLNGLLTPTGGTVHIDGVNINLKSPAATLARRKVGMVFQYPEQQLFEETVYDDIAFGPRNMGHSEESIKESVRKSMEFVGLDFEQFAGRSPFNLSGGQMRRVAIAGVIALEPRYLVLDEPSAGLDPRGRDEIFAQILRLYRETGITIIMVSHNMDDIARMATRLIVMNHGELSIDGNPGEVFLHQRARLREAGVDVPGITALMGTLKQHGLDVDDSVLTVEAAVDSIYAAVRGKESC